MVAEPYNMLMVDLIQAQPPPLAQALVVMRQPRVLCDRSFNNHFGYGVISLPVVL